MEQSRPNVLLTVLNRREAITIIQTAVTSFTDAGLKSDRYSAGLTEFANPPDKLRSCHIDNYRTYLYDIQRELFRNKRCGGACRFGSRSRGAITRADLCNLSNKKVRISVKLVLIYP